ncbi:hypothetical protein [Listeria seeligeri]|uniref:hypothetical protein n=1 Tax=Listeria seeligeri TaxID=1640 RepID=UPI0022EBEBA4|nr:hypothetical protein [Listeria seeligeri]
MIKEYEVVWEQKQTKTITKHGKYNTFEEALQSIRDWWALNEFEPDYVRYWTKNKRTTIDYGSHHMFYYIYELNLKNGEEKEQ